MFGRNKKTRAQLMRMELGESVDHLWQAMAHAAGGTAGAVAPKVDAARGFFTPGSKRVRNAAAGGWETTMAAFAPLTAAARADAVKATVASRKAKARRSKENGMARKRTGLLVGLLGVAAAAGATGALVARRKRHSQWDAYDPSAPMDSMTSDARSMVDRAKDKANAGLDKASNKTAEAMDSARSSLGNVSDKLSGGTEKLADKINNSKFSEKVGDAVDSAGDKASHLYDNSKNTRL